MDIKNIEKFRKPVKQLPPEVARKIAAGEVIDRPNAIIRELMDNSVDSGATNIIVEIEGGGIDKIRVIDNGQGMSKADLQNCAHPHATSKIETESDLLNLDTLGFRGEALSSISAVAQLEITSCRDETAWKVTTSIYDNHKIESASCPEGTIVQVSSLFANFPARRLFLKRASSEATLCRQTFIEKAIARIDISFRLIIDGKVRLDLPTCKSYEERIVAAFEYNESHKLFHQLKKSSSTKGDWNFNLVIGEPAVFRKDRRNIHIYVNGRKINEYSLVQAIEYGSEGFFPNGNHPVACLFLTMDPKAVDFNIHPAKREARFKDISEPHHAISSTVKTFFHSYAISEILQDNNTDNSFSNNQNFYQSNFKTFQPPTTQRESENTKSPIQKEVVSSFHVKSDDLRCKFFSDSYTNNYEDNTTCDKLSYSNDDYQTQNDVSLKIEQKPQQYVTNDKSSPKYIGTALGVFLLAEKDDVLYAIDQHAAHERIIFNKILESNGQKQELLVPYVIETNSDQEDEYLKNITIELEKAGFTLNNCGDGRWEVFSVPINWHGTEADLYNDIIENKLSPTDVLRSFAATSACRAAIKDGAILDDITAQRLVTQTFELKEKRCPHGRPVMTSFSRSQLFQLVQRT